MKKKFYKKLSFWIGISISFGLAGLGAYLSGSIGERLNIGSWQMDLTFAVIFFMMGGVITSIFAIYIEKFEETNNLIDISATELKNYVGEKIIRSSILQHGHIAARYAVQQLFDKRAHHFLTEGAYLSILEYLYLLEDSLLFCSQEFFATSLLTPSQWLDEKNPNAIQYKRYLEDLKKKKSQFPEMLANRIFINRKEDFNTDIKMKKLVEIHRKANVRIGFCDFNKLIDPKLKRDFVFFKDTKGSWVVDTGIVKEELNKPLMDENKSYPIKVIDDIGYLNTNFSEILKELRISCVWL